MALLAAWNFDETTGATVTDHSGNGRNVNLVDNANYRAAGIFGTGSVHRGATLVGESSGVTATPFQTASFSHSYWAIYAGTGDSNLVQSRGAGDAAGPGPRITAAGALEGRWIDSTGANNAVSWTPPGGWSWTTRHHIVFSYDKTTGRRLLWVDGVLRIDSVLAGAPTPRPLQTLKVDTHVAGTRIDDLRVYSHVLTEAEVAADMANRVGVSTAPVVSRPIVGDPRPDALTFSLRSIGATSVRVKLATNMALTEGVVYGTWVTPEEGGRAQSVVTGLKPISNYFAGAEAKDAAGTVTATTQIARGRTLPAPGLPASFTVAFGSCFDTIDTSLTGSVNSAFGRIVARRPDLFLHHGDWTYADNVTASIASHLADHEASVDASTAFQTLLAEIPTVAIPSDHDRGGGNNAAVGPWSAPNRAARLAMIPHPPRPNPDGLYTSWVVGRVRFIVLDTAYLGTSTSRLGAAQVAWLKSELLQPEPLKVLVMEGTWIDNRPASPGSDAWPAKPADRDEIGTFIETHDVGQIIGLHGDQHALSADDGRSNLWGGFPTFCAAPFRGSSSHKVANPLVDWNRGIHPTATGVEVAQYGMMHVTDNGASIAVRIDGYDTSDTVRVTLDVNVDTRRAAVTWWDGSADRALTSLPARWDGAAERPVSAFWTGTETLPCTVGDPVLPGPTGPLVAHWDFDDLSEPPDVTYDRQARRPLALSGFSRTTTDTGWGLAAVNVDALGETPPAAIDLTADVLSVSARVTLSRQLAGVELLDANDIVVARLEARMTLVSGTNYRPAPRFTVTASGSSATSTQTMTRESATYARLVGVYDGQTVRAYINGGLVRSVPLVGVAAPVRRIRINLGASAEAVVDDVRVYSKALTLAEITEINALMLAGEG